VDGCEILHQMKTVVNIPLFKGFLPSPGGAGFCNHPWFIIYDDLWRAKLVKITIIMVFMRVYGRYNGYIYSKMGL